jgi:hypothetical protein
LNPFRLCNPNNSKKKEKKKEDYKNKKDIENKPESKNNDDESLINNDLNVEQYNKKIDELNLLNNKKLTTDNNTDNNNNNNKNISSEFQKPIKPELRKRPYYVKFEKEDIDEILKL